MSEYEDTKIAVETIIHNGWLEKAEKELINNVIQAADKEIAFIKTSHQQILKVLEANRAELIGNYEAELVRMREVENKYQELLYQVASKFPDESRHDTAKRYIHDAEHGDHGPEKTDCG